MDHEQSNENEILKQVQSDNTKKPLFKRWWFWLIVNAVILFFAVAFTMSMIGKQQDKFKEQQKEAEKEAQELNKPEQQGYVYKEPTMTADELAKANAAIAAGISINDAANDFAIVPPVSKPGLDGKIDNPKAYQLNWNDIKKFSLGADNEYLYVRYDFYGTIPEKMATIDGDDIKSFMCNIDFAKFTTVNGQEDQGMAQIGLMYTEAKSGKDNKDESVGYVQLTPPRFGTSGVASPTQSSDKYGETVYGKNMSGGKVKGGPGNDFVIAAFPLPDYGILPGSEITIDATAETNSHVYHHSSIDVMLDYGSAKLGKYITWKLGSNTYTSAIPKI